MAEQTESRVTISRPPADVMAVIADLPAYPEWNEEVRSVEILSTDTGSGRPERVRFVLDASPIKDTYVLSYQWDGDRSVRWTLLEASMLAAMDGAYSLTDNGDSTTDVTYRLAVDLNVPVIGLLKRKGEKVVVDRALKGLKRRVES